MDNSGDSKRSIRLFTAAVIASLVLVIGGLFNLIFYQNTAGLYITAFGIAFLLIASAFWIISRSDDQSTSILTDNSSTTTAKKYSLRKSSKKGEGGTPRARHAQKRRNSENELVPDNERPIYGKKGDTCRRCGEKLPVYALECSACGSTRVTCPICKHNINYDSDSATCPVCRNEFHLPHLREAVTITGRCPSCRSKIRRYEIYSGKK